MSQGTSEFRLEDYSDWIGVRVLVAVVVTSAIAIVPMFWLFEIWGAIPLVIVLLSPAYALIADGRLHARALSVRFGTEIIIETIRGTLTYPRVESWWWYSSDELWLCFGEREKTEAWRIRATWQQVAQAREWLPPETFDVDIEPDCALEMDENDWRAYRLSQYEFCQKAYREENRNIFGHFGG